MLFFCVFLENVDELESEGVSNLHSTGTRLSKVHVTEGFHCCYSIICETVKSKSYFSQQYQYILQKGDESKQNHHLGGIVLM